NSAYEEIWGRSIDDLQRDSRDFLRGVHPEDRDLVREAMATLSDGESVDTEYRVNPGEDFKRWVWVQGEPITDDDGTVKRVTGFARDITERKRREQELQRRTRAMDEAPIGITISDPSQDDNPLIYANDHFQALTGYDKDEVIGRNCRFLQGKHTNPGPVSELREAIDSEETVQVELRNYRKDGTEFWNRVTVAPVKDEHGAVTNFVGFQQDISDRKQREKKLTELHEVAKDLSEMESVNDICQRTIEASRNILEFDLSVIDIEESGILKKMAISEDIPLENMKDMSVEEGIAGKTYRTGESFLIDDLQTHEEANPQGPYRAAISVPIGDHGIFQAVAETANAFDEDDLELAELLISHAESALNRVQHEQQLQRQNERLDTFASVVSHDLQTPLNVAQGRLELAKEECDSDHLDDAVSAVDRSLNLLDDLLTLAREGEGASDVQRVELAETIKGCWQNVPTENASLVIETERSIRADPSRLKQLLENLMRNAIDHGGSDVEGGFYVADDGPGIPEDRREKIFEVGFSTTEEGTGFGLNIVREIANAHDWHITVTDSKEGGARFEITGVDIIGE
ncbi:MAG: PAS domain S-box protein, partial [Halobacteriaceae archaeon]